MPDLVSFILSLAKYLLVGMTLLLCLAVIFFLFKSPSNDSENEEFPELWWFRKK